MCKAKELEAITNELNVEKNHLEQKLKLLGAGKSKSLFTIPDALGSIPQSISGLENTYLHVSAHNTVENCNSKLENLSGIEKEEVIGTDLSDIDALPWAPGLFATHIRESQLAKNQINFETSYVDTVSGTARFLFCHALVRDERSVNIAARLFEAAEGGEILVTQKTCDERAGFVGSYPEKKLHKIKFEKIGKIRVKGITAEIPIAQVLYDS
jgi:hypothetical protein